MRNAQKTLFAALLATMVSPVIGAAQTAPRSSPWKDPHAKVLPQGELEYAPEPFRFVAGPTVRYIDFAAGKDDNPGTRNAPWQHHPWDPEATGQAKAARGAITYVFKRGVVYRGRLIAPKGDAGTAQTPIRLTSDPEWGQGEASIYGSQTVTGWKPGAHPRMPEAGKVWSADVDFLPRTLWLTGRDGAVTRLKLARHPNWNEPDANDVMSEWPTWENPDWWKGEGHVTSVRGQKKHLGINRSFLTGSAEDYVGATVWSEWGIVMGSPYPALVEAFDEDKKGVAFRGPWTYQNLEKIIRGNRFYLEDRPQWLDEPGEFWVERSGSSGRGRIYLRLPGDVDPNGVSVEAGKYPHLLDARELNHVHVSGLSFRFTNVAWRFNVPSWDDPDLKAAVVRLNGSGENIQVNNCLFEHVNMPVRLGTLQASDSIENVRITDNIMRHTDQGGVAVRAAFGSSESTQYGRVGHVDLLRNNLSHIGWRIVSGEHGHAVDLAFPTTTHVAGNFLHRIAGWGISVMGGKPSDKAGVEVPFARHLIHHNRVEDALVKSNDWGAIETWQGGPFYVFNNLVINPIAFKNWTFRPGDPTSIGSFGHAYYLDGSFKNYYFNNIAKGRNNTLGTKGVNTTALQNIYSFENAFFHNTFYKFAETTRQQAPAAGRFRYLSNIIEDSSKIAFRHADPKKGIPDPNASHYKQGATFDYPTLAYSRNLFHNIRGDFGVFEETGYLYKTLPEMQEALERLRPQASAVGTLALQSPLRDAERGDFRPTPAGGAGGMGTRVFVPWALYGVAGEWHFTRNNLDPARIIDEHWYMTANYNKRQEYARTPRYALHGHNIGAGNFVKGLLEDWTEGGLQLNGKDQHLVLEQERIIPPPTAYVQPEVRVTDAGFARITTPSSAVPGRPFDVTVELTPAQPEMKVRADLHWVKKDAFGGWMASGGEGTAVDGGQARRFALKPGAPDGLLRYSVTVYVTPTGNWNDAVHKHTVPVARTEAPPSVDPAKVRTVDMDENNFLVELVLQTGAQAGTLVAKHDGKVGYLLDLDAGRPRLRLQTASGQYAATATVPMAGPAWRHLVVEVNRATGVTFYLDGKQVPAQVRGPLPSGSLSNAAHFLVGGGPGQVPLAATLDFLRISRGTLAEAQTTIEELHAWQFQGPHLADFAGNSRLTNNAAGALVR